MISTPLVEIDTLTAAINAMGQSLAASFASIQAERRRLANVIAGTRAGTWEWVLSTDEIHINSQWANLLGYDRAELSPTTLETWRRLTEPGETRHTLSLIQRHLRGELMFMENEFRMRHKEGHWVWIYSQGRVVEYDETVLPH